ncbi:MAG: TonB-dependent receptor [Woeseiaceae bacterium]|nr:TonB-dependent receptor [Woeseiaceae bacterium]
MNRQSQTRWPRALLVASAITLSVGVTPSAFAQAQDAGVGELEEIVVTGSRIKRNTFDYSTPVTVIDSAEISSTGTTNLGDLLQTLPQAISTFNNANTAFSTTFSGLNLTDLRFLGTARTLVLVNGRRMVSGTPPGGGYGVDLNAIPTAMIERIEVLTGGASAIYGSDAVAGVVNIITKTDFEGIQIDAQVGAATQGDKEKSDLTITAGGEFGDGGFAMLSVGWSDDEELRSRDRSFSAEDQMLYDVDGDGFAETPGWLGSSFPPQGRISGLNADDGTPFRSGTNDRPNSDRFNRAEYRTIFAPVRRRFASANASYPLSDRVTAFAEANWAYVQTDSEIEPFALSINDDIFQFSRGGNTGLDVASNLLMSPELRTALLANGVTNTSQAGTNGWVRRLVEFGPRASLVDRTTARYVAGIDAELTESWSLSAYYTYGRTEQDQQETGQINTERAALALDVELAPDGVTIQCADPLARIQGCVPFNPFGENTITPQAVRYLQAPQNLKATVEQEVFNIGVTGDLGWELPGGTVATAFGFEHREESGSEINGGFAQTGVGGGNATAPTNGSFNVQEFFGEISFPVLDRLTLDVAARQGEYSTVGGQTTWKVGFDAPVLDTIRFRGTVSESVRAPNVADLFAGAGETFRNLVDPCDGVTNATTGQIADNCRSIPVIQNRIDATGSFTLTQIEQQGTGGFIGGNPLVQEETAEALTVGVIWKPEFLDGGLSVAVDYYDIEIDDGIATTLRTTVLERCYDVPTSEFDPTCGPSPTGQPGGAARRDLRPGAGNLTGVDSGTSNENRFVTSGLDIEASYSMDIGPGVLNAGMVWNHLLEWEQIGIVSGDVDDDAGEILTPENRATFRFSYAWDNWSTFWRVRMWGEANDSNTPLLQDENGNFFGVPFAPERNTIDTYYYHDFSVSYGDELWSVTAGINNAFDKEPPFLGQASQYGNTGTNTAVEAYDTVGSAWYLQFNWSTE